MSFGKKREDEFFLMFQGFSGKLKEMGENLASIMNDNCPEKCGTGKAGEPSESLMERRVAILRDDESECDVKMHDIMEKLNESFITPFDREDICSIASQMDDIADYVEETANILMVYDISAIREDAAVISTVLKDATQQVDKLFGSLTLMKKSKESRKETKEAIVEINRLENVGDELFCKALTTLFRDEKDPIQIIKWKDIYECLEGSLDACETLADTIRGVLAKNA